MNPSVGWLVGFLVCPVMKGLSFNLIIGLVGAVRVHFHSYKLFINSTRHSFWKGHCCHSKRSYTITYIHLIYQWNWFLSILFFVLTELQPTFRTVRLHSGGEIVKIFEVIINPDLFLHSISSLMKLTIRSKTFKVKFAWVLDKITIITNTSGLIWGLPLAVNYHFRPRE